MPNGVAPAGNAKGDWWNLARVPPSTAKAPPSRWRKTHPRVRDQEAHLVGSDAGPRHGCCDIRRESRGWARRRFRAGRRLQFGSARSWGTSAELTVRPPFFGRGPYSGTLLLRQPREAG